MTAVFVAKSTVPWFGSGLDGSMKERWLSLPPASLYRLSGLAG
jgi:hypothetical protein